MDPLFRPSIFDAQLHPLELSDADLRDLAFFGVEGAVAAVGEEAPDEATELGDYLRRLTDEAPARLRAATIAPFALLGIPPSRIPERGFEELLATLPSLFSRARVVGIGRVGLEAGGAREERALMRQLELARDLGSRVVVQTPAREKARHTRRILAMLRESELPADRVLVARTESATVRLVRECGHWASLAVHPRRLRAEDVVAIVKRQGAAGLLLGSDAGAGPGDLLALPRTVHLLEKAGLSREVVRRVSRENALEFFGIDRRSFPRP